MDVQRERSTEALLTLIERLTGIMAEEWANTNDAAAGVIIRRKIAGAIANALRIAI